MLGEIQVALVKRQKDIDEWFASQWQGLTPLFYFSCDIRHSASKLAVVDTNLFPAGFNNLCNSYLRETTEAIKAYLSTYHPAAKKILLFCEDHTRNKYYLKNVFRLKELIEAAGYEVKVGALGQDWEGEVFPADVEVGTFLIHRVQKIGDKAGAIDFIPDLILSNNDFSTGIPTQLQGISQPVIPPPALGWHSRTKGRHFDITRDLITSLAQVIGCDPWLLCAYHEVSPLVDFTDASALEELSVQVEGVLAKIREKYKTYKIEDTPYVYLKNNSGTYGMGMMTAFSGEEVKSLSRRDRNKLLSSKGKVPVTSYLIQEGVPTADYYSGYPIEPVIYGIGAKDIGGFFRIHESRNEYESLNSPGMSFSCLCLHKLDEPHEDYFLNCRQKQRLVGLSRLLARVAALASAKE